MPLSLPPWTLRIALEHQRLDPPPQEPHVGELGDELSEPIDDLGGALARRQELAGALIARPLPSAMLPRLGLVLRLVVRILFAHVLFDQRSVDTIRDASHQARSLVYVMQTRSLLDYLYFNYALLERDLPLAHFSNGARTAWLRGLLAGLTELVRRRPREAPEDQLQALALAGEAAFLFLERPRQDPKEARAYSQAYLFKLVRAQKMLPPDEAIVLVPLALFWERRPDPQHQTVVDEVFGTVQSPGTLRKTVGWIQALWQSALHFGDPIAQAADPILLGEFLAEYPQAGSADASELLRDRLEEQFRQEQHLLLGPAAERPERLWRELEQRPEIAEALAHVARAGAEDGLAIGDVAGARRLAHRHFLEIASRPSLRMFKFFSLVLGLVFHKIYDGFEIDELGLERVRQAGRDACLVLIPSHKSHVDYLVISYLFYHAGLHPPLIAAGQNLAFWPLGWFFRKAGAFFIRRSFKGQHLYPVVFREYLVRMMEQRYPVEFFIEGTRSRTGKLVKPKYGMLDMIVRACASGRVDAIKLVPISVGYEQIVEQETYRRELMGAEKRPESLAELLKAPRFLASRYGRLYVQFSEPIDLVAYLERYGVHRPRPDEEALERMTVRLAHRIIYDINGVTTVTPSALAATVLLNNQTRNIDRHRLLHEVAFLLHVLMEPSRGVRLSRTLRDQLAARRALLAQALGGDGGGGDELGEVLSQAVAPAVEEALHLLEDRDQLQIVEGDGERFYSAPEERRQELSFYRNTIVHHFVPEGLLACAFLGFKRAEVGLEVLMDKTLFLSRLFKYEWIYGERAAFEQVFLRTLAYLERRGWLRHDQAAGAVLLPHATARVELEYFRGLVLSFLEAYTVMAAVLEGLSDDSRAGADLVDEALRRGRNDYLRGRILYYESLVKPTFQNALRLFRDWGVIEPGGGNEEGTHERYQLSEPWRQGTRLREFICELESLVYLEERAVRAPRIAATPEGGQGVD